MTKSQNNQVRLEISYAAFDAPAGGPASAAMLPGGEDAGCCFVKLVLLFPFFLASTRPSDLSKKWANAMTRKIDQQVRGKDLPQMDGVLEGLARPFFAFRLLFL